MGEIGTGLNSYMTSDWCSKLLEREAVPLFKQGRHGEGLVNVVEGLAQRLRDIDQGLVNPDDGTVECGMLIAGALVYTDKVRSRHPESVSRMQQTRRLLLR